MPKKPPYYGKCIEGAVRKANGKWSNPRLFPGRDFDDLDEYRAAKKQRTELRVIRAQANGYDKGRY